MLEDKPRWWIGKDSLGIGKSLICKERHSTSI